MLILYSRQTIDYEMVGQERERWKREAEFETLDELLEYYEPYPPNRPDTWGEFEILDKNGYEYKFVEERDRCELCGNTPTVGVINDRVDPDNELYVCGNCLDEANACPCGCQGKPY